MKFSFLRLKRLCVVRWERFRRYMMVEAEPIDDLEFLEPDMNADMKGWA